LISASFPIWEIFLTTRILIGLAVSGVAAVAMTYIGENRTKDIGFAMGCIFQAQRLVEWVGV
jgi:YNFM family putative membrane transporter